MLYVAQREAARKIAMAHGALCHKMIGATMTRSQVQVRHRNFHAETLSFS
jgi:hypothetical protein